jgi:hypothetical protein
MSWRALTEADILQRLSGAELEALREAALADSQADPVAAQIAQTVDFVRGYIAANASNTLGPVDTLPERLILPAVDILCVDISTRAAGMLIDPDGQRAKAKQDAIRLVERVADGKYAVEAPETATTETASSSTPKYITPTSNFNAASQDGI